MSYLDPEHILAIESLQQVGGRELIELNSMRFKPMSRFPSHST